MSDDEDSEYGGLYEDGRWEWDEEKNQLEFVRDANEIPEEIIISKGASTGTIHFRDDLDVFEQIQMRYKHRYQRKVKYGEREVITLQDVKDIAIYTASVNIMSDMLIYALHRPTTERFLRALIFYCQYYFQVTDVMSNRKKMFERKLRTPQSKLVEDAYRNNLCDLRLLVAKEYCTMTIGGADTKHFHHMGPRKRKSLTDRDARLYETLLRMFIQIVWLALGRKAYNQIELEVNRLFKTEIYNLVEHNLRTGYISKMSPEDRNVCLGHCLHHDKKLKTRSPLLNEIFCHRHIDYRLMSFGVVKLDKLTPRLQYLHRAIVEREETFEANKVVIGILGQARSLFDVMLNPVSIHQHQASRSSKHQFTGARSVSSMTKAEYTSSMKLYSDIEIPAEEANYESLPADFPDTPAATGLRRSTLEQCERWINRLSRILNARKSTIC